MGGGGKHTSNTHVINYENENVTNTHNNVKNLENHYKENNLQTNIHNGDRALGGAVNIMNDVNSGTAIYKLNLQNLFSFNDLAKVSGAFNQYAPMATKVIGGFDPKAGMALGSVSQGVNGAFGIASAGMSLNELSKMRVILI